MGGISLSDDAFFYSFVIFGVASLLFLGGLVTHAITAKPVVTETKEYEAYTMTAPFGFFSVKGSVSGSAFGFSGSISSSESYDVKYFQDEVIKTIILDAEKTDVVVDGTLRLVRYTLRQEGWFFIWKLAISPRYKYVVHIPYLPEHDEITEDWVN
jgi:hypothetical protein